LYPRRLRQANPKAREFDGQGDRKDAPLVPISYQVLARSGAARRGVLHTDHGEVQTPQFMPVGTRGVLRAMSPAQARDAGASMILANAYHLAVKPGADKVARFGGLHRFMAWDGPILTDSGGFQVFSLPHSKITEEGVHFKLAGGEAFVLSPEESMRVQQTLGADIIMAFDECVPYPATHDQAASAVDRTSRWLERCKEAWDPQGSSQLFGIVQGSVYSDLRERSVRAVTAMDLPGYAIGGVSVGEGPEEMDQAFATVAQLLPEDKVRYAMGIGYARDLLVAIGLGVDIFDCVIPTRHARGGVAHTWRGRMRLTGRKFRNDRLPIDTECGCLCCRDYPRGVLHHLLTSKEVLGTTLLAIHNVFFLTDLCAKARKAIEEDRYSSFRDKALEALETGRT